MPDRVLGDIVLHNGTIYDGSGGTPYTGDVAINEDSIVFVGPSGSCRGRVELDVTDLAVSPGFINMLSWANRSLIQDGRSLSDIHQGVTLEVLGEGRSMGPLNDAMKRDMEERQGDIKFAVEWTTLDQYLRYLVRRGVSTNVASFVGTSTLRAHVMGYDDRPATAVEIAQMRSLLRQAMQEGAVGLSAALIYAPGCYASTDELVSLVEVVQEHDGMYISHLRNEGDDLLSAVNELIEISARTGVAAEIYHLKASGRANWSKLDEVVARVEAQRRAGLRITADMYNYPASSTGLGATMPPWVHDGGHDAWIARLKDPILRKRIKREMLTPSREWDNTYLAAGSAENIILVGFKSESLKPLTGKTLAQVAYDRDSVPEETAMDLVVEDNYNVDCVFFTMSEDNIRKQIALPWMSFCSDGASLAPEGVFLNSSTHPRSYGSFARLLGKYVRDEQIIPLQEAIRRLSWMPAQNLKLKGRGKLAPGYKADIAVFDPIAIEDKATFANPHQLATGMIHVFVNGTQVLKDGSHTGSKPGRVVRGPSWTGQ